MPFISDLWRLVASAEHSLSDARIHPTWNILADQRSNNFLFFIETMQWYSISIKKKTGFLSKNGNLTTKFNLPLFFSKSLIFLLRNAILKLTSIRKKFQSMTKGNFCLTFIYTSWCKPVLAFYFPEHHLNPITVLLKRYQRLINIIFKSN